MAGQHGWFDGYRKTGNNNKEIYKLRMASHVFAVAVFFLLFLTLGTNNGDVKQNEINYCRKIS